MFSRGGRTGPHIVAILLCLFLLMAYDAASSQLPSPLRQAPPPALDLITSFVTVTASKGVPPRLAASDFHLMEDGVEQKIEYFAVHEQPATVGIVWGGGTGFEDPAPDPDMIACPREFVRNLPIGSEYFVLSGDKVTTSFTTNVNLLPKNYAWSGASSDTVFIGLDVLKESASFRRILFVVTKPDGGGGGQLQNSYLERVAINQGYQIHVVVFDTGDSPLNGEGQIFLSEMADLSGGSFTLTNVSNVICANLAKEIRVQYLLGYRPKNSAKDGKWRRLSVKVSGADGSQKLKARIRRGYDAAKDRG
jgi:Ca-activated chloride channel family protein